MQKIILTLSVLFFCITLPGLAQMVTDINGNVYNTVTIGAQVWMAGNLKATKYNNGDLIANVTSQTEWISLTTGAYCWQNDDPVTNADTYGALYNNFTVDAGNLCPTGWHVPTDDEWTILTDFLGGLNLAGSKLKETGTTHWAAPNTGATNDAGFTALPGGSRGGGDGVFHDLRAFGYLWSSTKTSSAWAYARRLDFNSISVTRNTYLRQGGFSVRCIKDIITSITDSVHELKVILYPNPATDKIYLYNVNYINTLIMIFDLHGNLVMSKKIDSNSIDISNLENGIYFIKLDISGKVFITKFIKK
jgi:uncharacterized protein (TIGR02145 family)